jgi:molecular chaperone DnaJ
VEEKSKRMTLSIPAGVDDGKRIVIPHQGDAGTNGGPSGDLIVVIHVQSHTHFQRDGQDLYCAVPITFSQAVLGAVINIKLLDGKQIEVKIPSGTAYGKLLRVKNEGVPYTGSSRKGDLYIKILVQIPQHISSRQKALLEQYAELDNATKSPQMVPLSSLR